MCPRAAAELDAVFLALPHGEAMARVPAMLAAGGTGGPHGDGPFVFDLSGDFRIKDAATFKQYYGLAQTAPTGPRRRLRPDRVEPRGHPARRDWWPAPAASPPARCWR